MLLLYHLPQAAVRQTWGVHPKQGRIYASYSVRCPPDLYLQRLDLGANSYYPAR